MISGQCLQNSTKFILFHVNHAAFGSSWTTQVEIFPGPSQLQKLNQFKPVLASGKFMKNLNFPTSCINFTHFYFEFLKDFYIFRISGPSGSLWYQWLQDSSSIHWVRNCPQEMVVSLNFLMHSNLHNSLNNNIKPFFGSINTRFRNPGQSFTLITMGSS